MKKCYIGILFLAFVTYTNNIQAQAVESGKLEAELGFGFGLYGLGDNIDNNESSFAIPGLVNFKAQYAVTQWFSPGLMYERNGFITNPDSAENAKSGNFYLALTFRVLNKERTAIHTSINLGSSNYEYENEGSKDKVTAKGGAFQLGFGIKHFISDHIGIGYDFALASYAYDELKVDGETIQYLDLDTFELVNYEIGFVGVNHRIGITYKF